ncbi:MAG: site-specific integrase [Candidatus Thermoplasmatota archaeon]
MSCAWVSALTIHARSCLGRFYPDGEIPPAIHKALRVTKGGPKPRGRVITPAEFNTLLETATKDRGCAVNPRLASLRVALLWCLWDSGMRCSELLGLNVGDVHREGEITRLCMPRDGLFQKTGPRDVEGVEMTRPLAVWLNQHPGRNDPSAPLFPLQYDPTGKRRICHGQVNVYLRRWSQRTGLDKPGYKQISAHDFRHTRMTRLARANWHPAKI